jgi:hypothetical protein
MATDTHRYTVAVAVGVVSTDPQLVSNFADLFVSACEQVAETLATSEDYKGKLELFPIMPGEDDEVQVEA